MITFDDWLEMQNNGVLMLIDEFKKAPVYNEQNCYATVLDKDTICIYANENSLVLGYKTMYQMIWHYKLYDITLVCKLLDSLSNVINIDTLRSAGLGNTWEETFDNLVKQNSWAIDMIKKIMSMKNVSNVYLDETGMLGLRINEDDTAVDKFIHSIPELYYVDINTLHHLDIFSRDGGCSFENSIDITKEMKQCLC